MTGLSVYLPKTTFKKMELHQALKHIIKTEGADIITDLRLVNILNDFNAYKDIPTANTYYAQLLPKDMPTNYWH